MLHTNNGEHTMYMYDHNTKNKLYDGEHITSSQNKLYINGEHVTTLFKTSISSLQLYYHTIFDCFGNIKWLLDFRPTSLFHYIPILCVYIQPLKCCHLRVDTEL